jgi:nitrous oxidase accessory protein NosD
MRTALLVLLCLLASLAFPQSARAARSYDNCTGFITSLPAVVGTSGTWCLKQDLTTSITTGHAITITANDVTIDCNDFSLDGRSAGAGTQTIGIYTDSTRRETVRHCHVVGFLTGINFINQLSTAGGHLVEDNFVDSNTLTGIGVSGDGSIVRRNRVFNTGGSTSLVGSANAIGVAGTVDVLDNTISGVVAHATPSNGYVYGIYLSYSPNSTVAGNDIRGLLTDSTNNAYGVYVYGTGQVAMHDNILDGDAVGQSLAFFCSNATSRARNNVIAGFTGDGVSNGPYLGCTDAGKNDVSP